MHIRSAQPGFTIVEGVLVILALGMLSTVALPRLRNQGNDARRAKVEALQGAVSAAVQLTRAAALEGDQMGATGTVALDGTPVDTRFGYPAATVNGILAAAASTGSPIRSAPTRRSPARSRSKSQARRRAPPAA